MPDGTGLIDAIFPFPGLTPFPSVDTIAINGVTMPGKWTLLSAPKKFGWQINKGYGLSGATVVPIGDELIVAKFKAEIWSAQDQVTYKTLRNALLVKPVISGGNLASLALGVSHPELAALGMSAFVPLVTGPQLQTAPGLWTQEFEFLQFRAPQPAPKRPATSIPADTPPKPTALTATQVQIQQELARQQALTAHVPLPASTP